MSADKDYLALPLQTFLADLAAKSPTPGGGSTAALVGAVAACQARMVLEYSVGRAKGAEHEPRLHEILAEFGRAEQAFSRLMTEDMSAYERWAAARKGDDADEQQRAVATAVTVPMEIVALAAAAAGLLDEVKAIVNPYLFSDLQVAVILTRASAHSAAANARVNLRDLADRMGAQLLGRQLDDLLVSTDRHHDAVQSYKPTPRQ